MQNLTTEQSFILSVLSDYINDRTSVSKPDVDTKAIAPLSNTQQLSPIVFFYFVKSDDTAKVKNRRILSVCLLLSSLALIVGIITGRFEVIGANIYTLFGISFFLIAISQYLYPVIILDNKLFGLFGKHSYPIYLFHYLLIHVYSTDIQRMLGNSMPVGIIGWALRYLFVVITSLIVGIVADKLIAIIKERKTFCISRTIKNRY